VPCATTAWKQAERRLELSEDRRLARSEAPL
jgi:hypothetical protein